jgi:hypothetical protein
MIELPALNGLQRDKNFLLDEDDEGYLSKLLYQEKTRYTTDSSIFPTQLFSVDADDFMIPIYNQLLHRHYKTGPNEFFFWKKKKMLNQATRVILKMENDDYGHCLLPIFLSMKALDQSKIIFAIKKNFDSVFGFDLFVDRDNLDNNVNLLQLTPAQVEIHYHLSFLVLD